MSSSPTGVIDDDGFVYASVPEIEPEPEFSADGDAGIASLVHNFVKQATVTAFPSSSSSSSSLSAAAGSSAESSSSSSSSRLAAAPQTNFAPVVTDDFIRNFFVRHGLRASLESFNTEWYELRARGVLSQEDVSVFPDVYVQSERLSEANGRLRADLARAADLASRAQSVVETLKRERDFHRLHHKRVVQEKNDLVGDLRRLRTHAESLSPALLEIRGKYEAAMREKMLVKIDRDKLAARLGSLEAHIRVTGGGGDMGGAGGFSSSSMNVASSSSSSSSSSVPAYKASSSLSPPRGSGTLAAMDATTSGGGGGALAGRRAAPTSTAALAPAIVARAASQTGIAAPTASSLLRLAEAGTTDGLGGGSSVLKLRGGGGEAWPRKPSAYPTSVRVGGGGFKIIPPSLPSEALSGHSGSLPLDGLEDPYAGLAFEPAHAASYAESAYFKAHGSSPVSSLAFHPSQPYLATVSDDCSWRLWRLPEAELLMTGKGHKSWIAGAAFHPYEGQLATAGGDGVIKLWNLNTAACTYTSKGDHAMSVWGVAYHSTGDFFLSASQDHTSRLFDSATGRVRHVLRGHMNSVNAVAWKPLSATAATGSSDKSISLWDTRTAHCYHSLFGHLNSVQDVVYDLRGDALASCDADGIIRVWDVKTMTPRASLDFGHELAAHSLTFDRSSTMLVAACEDGSIQVIDLSLLADLGGAKPPPPGTSASLAAAASLPSPVKVTSAPPGAITVLRGHTQAVQSVAFSPDMSFLVSGGNDATVKIWSEYGNRLPPSGADHTR